jgi:protein O-GlcNAc transferase
MRPAPFQPILQQALAHHQAGRVAVAYPLYQQVQRVAAGCFDGWHLGGLAALQLGRLDEAARQLTRALALQPKSALCLLRLGITRRMQGQLEPAAQLLRRALDADPKLPEAWEHLAVVHDQSGRPAEALEAARRAAALKPEDHAAFSRVAHLVSRQQGLAAALPLLEEAARRWPASADAWKDLGTVLAGLHEAAPALAALDRALAIEPGLLSARLGRALARQEAFRIPEAVADYEAVLRENPAHAEAGSARLLCLNYLDTTTPGELRDAHFAYGRAQAAALASPPAILPPAVVRDRPLRVAVVSADFRRHAVASFFEPLLEFVDRSAAEIRLYHDHPLVDDVSRRLQSLAAHWRHVAGLSHPALETLLRADAPDVLIDLAGHTGVNRLPVYARRVAPVQINYLGYPNTTGLETMDYRFTDALADPEGATDAWHTERLVRFSPCAWAYRPPADAPDVAPPPCAGPGRPPVTFGSFNNPAKMGPRTFRLWARVLAAVPGSRLLLKGHGLDHPGLRAEIGRRFADAGGDAGRLEMIDRTPSARAHLELYSRVDAALDAFPYHGTTTTCEALWMGRPVVTLAGCEHRGRVGVSLLSACGRAAWAAASEDDYVRIAAGLVADPAALAAEASGLRAALAAGPLLDHAAQAARFWSAVRACAAGHP